MFTTRLYTRVGVNYICNWGGGGELGVFKKRGLGRSCNQCQGEHWKTMLK